MFAWVKGLLPRIQPDKLHHHRQKKLTKQKLFDHLSDSEWTAIKHLMKPEEYKAGEMIFHEGNPAMHIYILEEGEAEICKITSSGTIHTIANLQNGECFGESVLLEERVRHINARAKTKCKALKIDYEDLETLSGKNAGILTQITRNIATQVTQRLRDASEVTVIALEKALEHSKQQIALGICLAYTMFLLSLFAITSEFIDAYVGYDSIQTQLFNIFLLTFFAFALLGMLLHTRLPMTLFGFTLKNWKKYTLEAILWSVDIIYYGARANLLIRLMASTYRHSHEWSVL
ncbi:MAG: cyclic nucleotide-binding domain-containing protein [Gammaproteobacteria bacterium]